MVSRKGIGGRIPGLIDYREVHYNNMDYIIGTIQFKGEDIQFVIDKEDYDKIKDMPWHYTSNQYISTGVIHESKKKELYLHNLIMNRMDHPGKGASETVDHINRNGLDNRKENLRIISHSQQILNQSKKRRNVILPLDCTLKSEDIPKHIWYVHANGLHGDRFAIEFKTQGILWKSTSSKKISIYEKLREAKEKLEEYYTEYPYLNPTATEEYNALEKSFRDIIAIRPI